MYTEQDRTEIRRRIIKYSVMTAVIALLLLVGYVMGMIYRWEAWVMIDGALIFFTICFGLLMFIFPCVRYNVFLKGMQSGLGRSMEGTIVEVSENEDYQDGVRVLPVRILLKKEQDERIVYLNVSKKHLFPAEGTEVHLNCYGRHIREVEA